MIKMFMPLEAQYHFTNIRFVCSPAWMKRLFTCSVIAMILVFLYVEHVRYEIKPTSRTGQRRTPKDTSIEVFFYNRPSDFSLNVFNHCDYPCHMVNTGDYNKSSAVVFHSATLYNYKPLQKQNDHIWVFYALEPPHRHPSPDTIKQWRRLFNWTIGYRRDADILNTYGRFKTLPTGRREDMKQRLVNFTDWANKSDFAAWFVSNCYDNARRNDYANMLKKFIFVDKFGNCGPMKCPKAQDSECQRMLKEKYKFYMAFESEICRDYITEKSFKLFWDYTYSIPIVRGGGNYTMYLPSKSYINTENFNSIKELGKYTMALYKDTTKSVQDFRSATNFRSTQYFRWQENYYVDSMTQEPFCELCRMLHRPMKYRRVYNDINAWLRGNEDIKICQKRNDLH
ncbi:alpha-(1,3)-fucosyltransferase C-like [Argopecten irradians]|uniref:alpha-(1,3)-fucosyltransferase C-like n=1 Tax=Argopecten irradians TaxID=31199 RepID=UPI003719E628